MIALDAEFSEEAMSALNYIDALELLIRRAEPAIRVLLDLPLSDTAKEAGSKWLDDCKRTLANPEQSG